MFVRLLRFDGTFPVRAFLSSRLLQIRIVLTPMKCQREEEKKGALKKNGRRRLN